MKLTRLLLLAFLVLPALALGAQARTLSGEGRGASEDEARQLALKDLGSQIEVKVESVVEAQEKYAEEKGSSQYKASFNAKVKTTVDLPLLGVDMKTFNQKGTFQAVATMDGKKALPLYREKAVETIKGLDAMVRKLPSLAGKTLEPDHLLAMLSEVEQLEKYRSVMAALGLETKDIPQSPVQMAEIKTRLLEIEGTLDTLEKAARKLSKGIDQKNIYVYPPVAPGSTEITAFAGALRSAVQGAVQSIDDPQKATWLMRGNYEITNDGIDVMYRLMKLDGTVVKTTSSRLLPAAYAGYDPKPSTVGIDQLIKQGLAVGNDFRIEATTNRGKRDLLFQRDEEIEILVKMNRPGYLYAVEHVKNEQKTTSLLLELEPSATGNRKFVFFVNGDDVNKWISIGKFNITPPFGIERLQFIASGTDLVDRLPGYYFDQTNYNYVVGDKTENAISEVRTRGLTNTKRPPAGGAKPDVMPESAETFLTFTTMNAQ